MNNMKILQYLSIASLLFLVCSRIYGIIVGIYYTNEYFRLTEIMRNQTGNTLTAGTLFLNYFSGGFRGIITIACGVIGLTNIKKQEVRTGYYIFLGILTLFYILGLIEFPFAEEFVQMLISVYCFGMLGIFKYKNRYNAIKS